MVQAVGPGAIVEEKAEEVTGNDNCDSIIASYKRRRNRRKYVKGDFDNNFES